MKNIQTEPQPGDIIQILPKFIDQTPPAPLRVTDVTETHVHWMRDDEPHETPRGVWESTKMIELGES